MLAATEHIKAAVAAMIPKGAALWIVVPGGSETLTLAKLVWLPGHFKWCAVFPEDQHHVHTTPYSSAAINHGLYVVLYDAQDNMIAQVCPLDESTLDNDSARAALANWQALLLANNGTNAKQFENFFAEN